MRRPRAHLVALLSLLVFAALPAQAIRTLPSLGDSLRSQAPLGLSRHSETASRTSEKVFALFDVEDLSLFVAPASFDGRIPGGQTSLFQGARTDPVNGLAYHRNRWYDPRTASWLSEDPAGAVDSPNLYAFVGWGPQVGRVPLGLNDVCAWFEVNGGPTPPECQPQQPLFQFVDSPGSGGLRDLPVAGAGGMNTVVADINASVAVERQRGIRADGSTVVTMGPTSSRATNDEVAVHDIAPAKPEYYHSYTVEEIDNVIHGWGVGYQKELADVPIAIGPMVQNGPQSDLEGYAFAPSNEYEAQGLAIADLAMAADAVRARSLARARAIEQGATTGTKAPMKSGARPNSTYIQEISDGHIRTIAKYSSDGKLVSHTDYIQDSTHVVDFDGVKYDLQQNVHEHALRTVPRPDGKGTIQHWQVRIVDPEGNPTTGWVYDGKRK